MKPIYIAAYHQSKFGKLYGMTVPEILRAAVDGACGEIGVTPAALDVASVASACSFTLNEQGLLAGLLAGIPGLEAKPIESVENACASGGQAVLSVWQKLQLGLGETGISVGYEKMRGADGKMDGKLIGKVLGYFSHPDDRSGKTFVFPHIFAEIMKEYMQKYDVPAEHLANIAVEEYANARHNPYAQMQNAALTLDQAMTIGGVNRLVAGGLPLKTYDCSQITDGYAALILATQEGLARLGVKRSGCAEIAGIAQATDPLQCAGRDVLRPRAALAAMGRAYAMAGLGPHDVDVAELHDCFTVMGAIGAEVIGMADPGRGARFWLDGHARVNARCAINSSGGLIAKGHPVGATGVAMIGWCFWQLTGRAPAPLQAASPRAAATFNIGGPVCASVCSVLRP